MISILIPTYNYQVVTLVETIHQQCENINVEFEIIVLDDASTNQEIFQLNQSISGLTNVIFIKNETNLGRTSSRNILANLAKYNWLLFLDSDVIPVYDTFISDYLSCINLGNKVVFGGYSYQEFDGDFARILRWKYGKSREEASAEIRNKYPFSYVFSGNFLIDKSTFFFTNFKENKNIYGLDIYFSYQLYTKNIKLLHIDNPIYHLGLESNEIFFNKQITSLKNRKYELANLTDIDKINDLVRYYNLLKKYKLTEIVKFAFTLSEPLLKKQILSSNPILRLFDLYRLGYICTI